MPKQVKKTAPEAVQAPSTNPQNLFISVNTFDGTTGKTIGERIVDMCHYGTRNWLSNHLWWATHNGHCTEVNIATPEQSAEYVAKGREALAAKFNATETVAEPLAAAA